MQGVDHPANLVAQVCVIFFVNIFKRKCLRNCLLTLCISYVKKMLYNTSLTLFFNQSQLKNIL